MALPELQTLRCELQHGIATTNQVSTDMPEFFPWWDEPAFE